MWELGIFVVYITCSFFKKIITFAFWANFYKNRLCIKPTLFFALHCNENLHLQGCIWPSIRKGSSMVFFFLTICKITTEILESPYSYLRVFSSFCGIFLLKQRRESQLLTEGL